MDNSRNGDVADRSILPFSRSAIDTRIEHLSVREVDMDLRALLVNAEVRTLLPTTGQPPR